MLLFVIVFISFEDVYFWIIGFVEFVFVVIEVIGYCDLLVVGGLSRIEEIFIGIFCVVVFRVFINLVMKVVIVIGLEEM